MAFIAANLGGQDDPDSSKKKKKKDEPEVVIQDLALEGQREKAAEEGKKLKDELERMRQCEKEREEEFHKRIQQVEEDLVIKHASVTEQLEERIRGAEQENLERKRNLGREIQKRQLLESQVRSYEERLRVMGQEVHQAGGRIKDREDAIERAAFDKEQTKLDLGRERQKGAELRRQFEDSRRELQKSKKQLDESKGRVETLKKELAEAKEEAESLREEMAAGGGGKAPKPKPIKLGELQKQFNALTKLRMSQDRAFLGWSKAQIDDPELIVKVVQFILDAAVRGRASDVHLEPVENLMRVRFRIDGLLEEVLEVPERGKLPVIPRIRVMCGLDPEQGTSTAKPQEGRMVISVDGRELDVRLSTFPTAFGDKAVVRLIYRSGKNKKISELGFNEETTELIQKLIHRPQGMIMVTGPAGSGKSTTLYTILQALNTPTANIVTLEDPIEMKLPGVNQCAVQPKIGFTFAEGLRAILRQDPNVIMVGEIRDPETAEIAMSASLTGHLLLTTLHTNSAAGAITRLLDMGLEPYLIASAVAGVFAQRLARKICVKCRQAQKPAPAVLGELNELVARSGIAFDPGSLKALYKGEGCDACRGTGYEGRILLFEYVQQFPGLRQLILEKAAMEVLQRAASREGMEPMVGHALRLAAAGETTLEEVYRLVG